MLLERFHSVTTNNYSFIISHLRNEMMKIVLRIFDLIKYRNSDMFNDVNIETTSFCNRRCDNCPNSIFNRSLQKNEKLLAEELFKKIIDDLKSIKFTGRISPHSFNEPLLDKRLVRLMKYAHNALPKAKLVIYTNGDFLDIIIMNDLYKAGVKSYVITLYGTHNEIEKNEKRMFDLKKYIKEKKMNISLEINNFSSRSNLSNRGGLINVKNISKTLACQSFTNPLVVNCEGDVILCCNDYLGQETFGNVEKESLLNIWNSERFKIIRKDVRNDLFNLNICKKCTANRN